MTELSLGCALMGVDFRERLETHDACGAADTDTLVALSSVRSLSIAQRHGGVVIGTDTNANVFRFPTVDDALRAVRDLHDLFDSDLAVGHAQVLYRIGIHYALAFTDADAALDAGLETAQQIVQQSRRRQILMSETAVERLSPCFKNRVFDSALSLDVGADEPLTLFEIVCDQDNVTAIHQGQLSACDASSQLTLHYQGGVWIVDADMPVLMAGRGGDCDLVVQAAQASRFHARFEFRQGRFIVSDQSKNGTLIELPQDKRVFLKHQELALWGSGTLHLGENKRSMGSSIQYDCADGVRSEQQNN